MRKVVIALLAVLSAGCSREEAAVGGKKAADWAPALRAKDPRARREAALALANLGPDANSAVRELADALKDRDPYVRAKAALALWSAGTHARPVVPTLTAALTDADADVRLNAAGALGEIGAEAKAALPALTKRLQDSNRDVRETAFPCSPTGRPRGGPSPWWSRLYAPAGNGRWAGRSCRAAAVPSWSARPAEGWPWTCCTTRPS
jgi:hypothetical protein